MSNENWFKLKTYSEEMKIELCFDIFGVKSLKLAESINLNTDFKKKTVSFNNTFHLIL